MASVLPRFKDIVAYLGIVASYISAAVTDVFSPRQITIPVFNPTLC